MGRLTPTSLRSLREASKAARYPGDATLRGRVAVHLGTCGEAAGAQVVLEAARAWLASEGHRDIELLATGCGGLCSEEPMMTVELREGPAVVYGRLGPATVRRALAAHVGGGELDPGQALGGGARDALPFFARQTPHVLRRRGVIDPERLEDSLAHEGYLALSVVLACMVPDEVIAEVRSAGLRGRGGAGFPTGEKWALCRAQGATPKYLIANCDEGDPGAYMDRSLLESDPHAVVEGMAIAAFAIGASRGFAYIRSEYPLAVRRMRAAVRQAEERGLLGDDILGSGFAFTVEIREGSGAFVCGEETALIHSIEGRPPDPRQRPPYPVERGLWGRPTVINNVETLANVPVIIARSAAEYAAMGTEGSKGTKIFSLVGKVTHTGLIEVPMGMTLGEIVRDLGGGVRDGRTLKAVLTGGPSGGCLSGAELDAPVDYESLREAGSMMGSGGMIVLDEDTCMVDVARFYVDFTAGESCGKCTTCRDGSQALLEVLTRISSGDGRPDDVEFLEELSHAVRDGSMCGLGSTLPNPVLSTIRHFREEYLAHIEEGACPALVCRELIRYVIDPEACVGCPLCREACPTGAVAGAHKVAHVIDQATCHRCGACFEVCPPKVAAVSRITGAAARALAPAGPLGAEGRAP